MQLGNSPWSALILFTKVDGQEQEIKLPYFAEAGTEILIGTRSKSKNFEVGQLVSVTSEEFTQICWTLFRLAASCAQRLEAYGKDQGFDFTNNSESTSSEV